MKMEKRYLYQLTSFLVATFIASFPLNSSFGASLKDSFEQGNSNEMNDIRLFIEEMRDEFDYHWNGFVEVFDIDGTSETNTSGLLLQFTEYNMGSMPVGACKEYAEDLYSLLIVDDLVVRVSEKYFKKQPDDDIDFFDGAGRKITLIQIQNRIINVTRIKNETK